jgi:branched-chain amino acid aminotransferase
MPINKSDKIWFNGEFVPWDEAQIHVMTHALHYGSSVFEGIRAYDTANGPAVWLLDGHLIQPRSTAWKSPIPIMR